MTPSFPFSRLLASRVPGSLVPVLSLEMYPPPYSQTRTGAKVLVSGAYMRIFLDVTYLPLNPYSTIWCRSDQPALPPHTRNCRSSPAPQHPGINNLPKCPRQEQGYWQLSFREGEEMAVAALFRAISLTE